MIGNGQKSHGIGKTVAHGAGDAAAIGNSAPGQFAPRFADDADMPPPDMPTRWTQRVPWLLVTAVLLAAALFALLLFGTR